MSLRPSRSNSTTPSSIRLSRFETCTCQSPRLQPDHLELDIFESSLQQSTAAALSYAIGDFGRAEHLIGHRRGKANDLVTFNLGAEWNVDDFLKSLKELSHRYDGVWIDQLSLPRELSERVQYLQGMPAIYLTLQVVVLFPNSPCPCLARRLRAGEVPQRLTASVFKSNSAKSGCVNAFPVSSYHARLWTKLEFGYSRTISAHNVSGPPGPCTEAMKWSDYSDSARFWSQIGNRYLQALWTRCRGTLEGYGSDVDKLTWSWMSKYIEQSLYDYAFDFFQYNEGSDESRVHLMANFLTGQQLKRSETADDHKLFFADDETTHRATVATDMVTAVFVRDKSYRIPKDFKTLSVTELFEDGIRQMETSQSILYLTALPAGLFKSGVAKVQSRSFGSVRFRPALCMDPDRVTILNDLYGKLANSSSTKLKSIDLGVLPLRSLKLYSSQRRQPIAFKAALAKKTQTAAIDWIRRCMQDVISPTWIYTYYTDVGHGVSDRGVIEQWATEVVNKSRRVSTKKWPSIEHETAVMFELVRPRSHWDEELLPQLPEFDLEEVCYRLVCQYLQVDVSLARSLGLGLVVHTGHSSSAPRLGMLSAHAFAVIQNMDTMRSSDQQDPAQSWLTVHLHDPFSREGEILSQSKSQSFNYVTLKSQEVLAVSGMEDKPVYNIVGVWLGTVREDGAVLAADLDHCEAVLS